MNKKGVEVMRASLMIAGILGTMAAQPAWSQQTMATLVVSATVMKSCAVDSIVGLTFGTILGTATSAQNEVAPGRLTFRCSVGTPWSVTADNGSNAGATRRMISQGLMPAEHLAYDLFTDAARTVHFPKPGDASDTNTSGTGTGVAQSVGIYGVITAGARPKPGVYQDAVVLTINY